MLVGCAPVTRGTKIPSIPKNLATAKININKITGSWIWAKTSEAPEKPAISGWIVDNSRVTLSSPINGSTVDLTTWQGVPLGVYKIDSTVLPDISSGVQVLTVSPATLLDTAGLSEANTRSTAAQLLGEQGSKIILNTFDTKKGPEFKTSKVKFSIAGKVNGATVDLLGLEKAAQLTLGGPILDARGNLIGVTIAKDARGYILGWKLVE